MREEEKLYKETKQKVDKQYRENETQYNDLMAQIQELHNKPNKSEIEQVKLDILKAQNVQLNFRDAKRVQEQWEGLKGDMMMEEFQYRSNNAKSFLNSVISGLIVGLATITIFELVNELLSKYINDKLVIVSISAIVLVLFVAILIHRIEKEEQKAQKDIAQDMIKKYPDIFQGKVEIQQDVKHSKVYHIIFDKILKKRL